MNLMKKMMEVRCALRSGKDAKNNFGHYDYRNAERMLSGIKPVLKKYGLTLDFTDDIVVIGERFYLKTVLTVYDTEDGEKHSVTSLAREPGDRKGMDASQVTGASITYTHKYALMSMFAISDPDLDPDSEAVAEIAKKAQTQVPPIPQSQTPNGQFFGQYQQPYQPQPQRQYPTPPMPGFNR